MGGERKGGEGSREVEEDDDDNDNDDGGESRHNSYTASSPTRHQHVINMSPTTEHVSPNLRELSHM